MKLGSNIIDIQKKNRCIVLQTLMEYPEISRVDLVRITELNKATITNIIQEFLDMGIVKKVGQIRASNGRKVAGIRLCMENVVSVILCIRKNYFEVAVCNVHGDIENYVMASYRSEHDIDEILAQYKKEVDRQLLYCRENNREVLGISVATLGWLYREGDKYYIHADDVPVFADVDIKQAFKDMYPDMEVWVDHDANMSALAEWYELGKKGERKPDSLLSIVCGLGFGGGIIIRGEVFGGCNGIAGEVGHMGINCMTRRRGKSGDYGGIWEEYASPSAIQEMVLEHWVDFPETSLPEEPDLEQIYSAYEDGDELAEWVMNRSARYLAYGLTGLIFILNPEVVVLGDKVIRSRKFEKKLYSYMERFLPGPLYRSLNIQFSRIEKGGILVGAGLAMVKHYLRTYKMIDFLSELTSTD